MKVEATFVLSGRTKIWTQEYIIVHATGVKILLIKAYGIGFQGVLICFR